MVNPHDVSRELKLFLLGRVSSYEQLETLLLLHRRRDDSFSPQAVAEVLHVSEIVVAEALEHLCRENLLDVQGAGETRVFKYAPASFYLAKLVDQLAEIWNDNHLTVMNVMSSNAIERVRTEALRTFSDAFLLGKKKSDG